MKRKLLATLAITAFFSGCSHLPGLSFQDKRYDKNAPIYHSSDPNRDPNKPRDLTEDDLKGK